MDKFSGKRCATGSMAPRKIYTVGSRDANTVGDQNAQFCNRIGCHGRIKYCHQDIKIGSSYKAKSSKTSFCSSNGNSSVSGAASSMAKISNLNSKREMDIDPSECSQSGDSQVMSSSDSSLASHRSSVPRKIFQQKSGLNKKSIREASSVHSVSRSSGIGTHSASNKNGCQKNVKCNSLSDIVPSNCSSSALRSSGKTVMKKRSPEGEGSLSIRGPSTSGISVSGSRQSSFTSGEYSSSSASVRTGRSSCSNQHRMGFSYQQNVRNSGREPAVRISRFPGSAPPTSVGRPSLSHQRFVNGSSIDSTSYSLSSSNDDNQLTLMPELGFSILVNREGVHRYNMDGIAEVLLALERIEQDEEMTHEQILALETSLFLSGLNLYDQHRDMRLDIDNMSYEELLALGERMGTVSTALSEEALSKCVRRSIYQVTTSEGRFKGLHEDGDDIKCSICQEEYERRDEIGKLVECQHGYHLGCINQWLQLKNWCPICKTAAAPTDSSSS